MDIDDPFKLTRREFEIAQLAATGQTCPQIATDLFLSVNTVKTHIKHIYSKTGTANRLQLYFFLTQTEAADKPSTNAS